MLKYFKYLNYIIRHKYYVLLGCWKFKLYFMGIIHDWSKFRPSEFFPYTNHFFGQKNSNIKKGRDSSGYYKATDTGDIKFDVAFFYHQSRNKHHWQYWISVNYDLIKPVDIPIKFVREMIADWYGAGKAQKSTLLPKEWFLKNQSKMLLTENTKNILLKELEKVI